METKTKTSSSKVMLLFIEEKIGENLFIRTSKQENDSGEFM